MVSPARVLAFALVPAAITVALRSSAPTFAAGQPADPAAAVLAVTKPGAPIPQAALAPPQPPKGAVDLVEAYLGTDVKTGQSARPSQALTIEGLIVTLPDPRASRFATTFDDHLGALQRGLESLGYSLDRFELPWAVKAGEPGKAGYPGVLLFRHASRPTLIVWAVGETPTSGVDKGALQRSLAEYASLVGTAKVTNEQKKGEPVKPAADVIPCVARPAEGLAAAPSNNQTIKLLGPTFSGSVPSLDIGLRNWAECVEAADQTPPSFQIVSGSATAVGLSPTTSKYEIAGAPFSATVARDAANLTAFLNYLCTEQGVYPGEVALLVEANTAYGQQRIPSENIANCSKRGSHASMETPARVPFPLHIAQLRETSRDVNADAKAPLIRTSAERTSVDLNADEGNETPPPYSPQAAAAAEVMLETSLDTIARARARYVGILASDVRDTILLARELRSHAPNAAIFTMNHELLYRHSKVNPALVGMIVVSSYPLVTQNRGLSYPFFVKAEQGIAFPTDRAIGVYNAVLALLDGGARMVEYGQPLDVEPSRPSHWLTVVGRGSVWPLKAIPQQPDDYLAPAVAHLDGEPPAPAVNADLHEDMYPVLIAWCGGCLFLLYAMGATWTGFNAARGRLRVLSGLPRAARSIGIVMAIVLMLIAHLLITVMVLIPFYAAFVSGVITVQWPAAVGTAVIRFTAVCLMLATFFALLLAGLLAVADVRRYGRALLAGWWQQVRKALLVVAAVTTGILSIRLASNWWTEAPIDQLFLSMRTLGFTGVSPLAPMLCVVIAGLCVTFSALRRYRLLDEAATLGPRSAPSWVAIDVEEKSMVRAFHPETALLPARLMVPVVVGAWFGLFFRGFAPPPEAAPFAMLFAFGFLAVYVGLVTEAARFVFAWWWMHGHLRGLAWHPAGALMAKDDDAPSLTLTRTSHPMTALRFLSAKARRLIEVVTANPADPNLTPAVAGQLTAQADAADRALTNAAEHDARTEFADATLCRRHAAQALTALCHDVAVAIDTRWTGLAAGAAANQLLEAAANLLNARSVVMLHLAVKQLQSLITFVTIGLLFMLLAVSIYPFQPHGWLLSFNWLVITSVVAVALVVFVQMDRDRIMSKLTGTTVGGLNLDRDFVLRIFLFVLIPIVSLVGANLPDSVRQLFVVLGAPSSSNFDF